MKEQTVIILIAIVFAIVIVIMMNRCELKCEGLSGDDIPNEPFSHEDKLIGEKALKDLETMLHHEKKIAGGVIPEISSEELDKLSEEILLVRLPEESAKEGLSYFHPINTRYWPYYYYSFPYNYKNGGEGWPPGMYSRLYFWSPGFYTGSGWSYYMRPGMGRKYTQRNRWVRNTQNGKHTYYYLTNRGDYTHDAADYSNTLLHF